MGKIITITSTIQKESLLYDLMIKAAEKLSNEIINRKGDKEPIGLINSYPRSNKNAF